MKQIIVIIIGLIWCGVLPARESIEVNENVCIHLLADQPVRYLQSGNVTLLDAEIVPSHQNLVRISAIEAFSEPVSLTLVCGNQLYTIEVNYGSTSKMAYRLNEFSAVPCQLYHGEALSEAAMEAHCEHILSLKRKRKAMKRFRNDGIRIRVCRLYQKGERLLMEVEYKNTTHIAMDIEAINWWIDDKRQMKAGNVQEYQIEPEKCFKQIKRIEAKSIVREVYVLPKLTIPDKRILRVEVKEDALGNTGRQVMLELKNKHILKAKVLSS